MKAQTFGEDLCDYAGGGEAAWNIEESLELQMLEGAGSYTGTVIDSARPSDSDHQYSYAWKDINLSEPISTIIVMSERRNTEVDAGKNKQIIEMFMTDTYPGAT